MKIYYNPSCSKCIEAIEIIRKQGTEPEIVEYLNGDVSENELEDIIASLGIEAEDLVRKNEPVYKEKYEGQKLTQAQWIKAMVDNPILIERPIVVEGNKVILGRPPQKVLELFS